MTAFEQGQLQPVENLAEELKEHPEIATATLNSLLTAQIPLSETDLQNLEQIAAAEGVAYPTLVATILHKYLSGQLVER